jgi:hypothetical protein
MPLPPTGREKPEWKELKPSKTLANPFKDTLPPASRQGSGRDPDHFRVALEDMERTSLLGA